MKNKAGRKNQKIAGFIPPSYCDYSCRYADFSPPDSIGACRKELSISCKKFKKYNLKNSKCLENK
jgi:hypothetical protein